MLSYHYFKIAWRNAQRNKAQSLINLLGLSVALSCVLLIALFIKSELGYDRDFADGDRIFRVNMNGKMGEEAFYAGYTPPPAGKALMDNFPEIESYARIYRAGDKVVRTSGGPAPVKFFTEGKIFHADSNFLQLLNYPLAAGDPKTCLLDPHNIVLSGPMARKYFGKGNAMGRFLQIEGDGQPYVVSGVLAQSDRPVSLSFDFLVPMATAADVRYFNWSWVWLNVATYVKFRDHVPTDAAAVRKLEAKFPAMMRQQAASAFDRIGQPYDEFLKKGGRWDLSLQALQDIHLHSAGITSAVTDQGDIKTVYIFSMIAFFILLLACVNFMNLSTARASKRAKEIGIRKVVGSPRAALIKQFFAEALIVTALAAALALLFSYLAFPVFNQLTGKTMAFSSIWSNGGWAYFLLLIVFCALLAGVYPALYLSGFKPLAVLKGQSLVKDGSGSKGLRNGLIIFQFSISTALVICTLIVYQQLRYTQIRDLGLDKENVIVLPNANRLGTNEESFKNDLKKSAYVSQASISSSIPGRGAFSDFYVPLAGEGDLPVAKDITLGSYLTDDDFINTMGVKLLAGRGFEKGYDDSRTVIINETAAKRMGYKDPVGKFIKYPGGNSAESYQVIGVMKDFNTESLHTLVTPFALFHASSNSYTVPFSAVIVRVRPGDLAPVLRQMEKLWKSYSGDTPFEYSFLRDDLSMQYGSDQQTAKIMAIFSGLAIVIACIGLLGLAIFAIQQRTKEIGIRKVLGATVSNIVLLLSKDFIKLIGLAIMIASPIAWMAMNKWLEDFAYRIDIPWMSFAWSAVLVLFVALTTLGIQAFKAAIANPVDSLRDE